MSVFHGLIGGLFLRKPGGIYYRDLLGAALKLNGLGCPTVPISVNEAGPSSRSGALVVKGLALDGYLEVSGEGGYIFLTPISRRDFPVYPDINSTTGAFCELLTLQALSAHVPWRWVIWRNFPLRAPFTRGIGKFERIRKADLR